MFSSLNKKCFLLKFKLPESPSSLKGMEREPHSVENSLYALVTDSFPSKAVKPLASLLDGKQARGQGQGV